MRRSTIWFVIAFLWLAATAIQVAAAGLRHALPAAAVTVLFLIAGFVHRRREAAAMRRPRIPAHVK